MELHPSWIVYLDPVSSHLFAESCFEHGLVLYHAKIPQINMIEVLELVILRYSVSYVKSDLRQTSIFCRACIAVDCFIQTKDC